MSTTRHTKGPFHIKGDQIFGADGKAVCASPAIDSHSILERAANARLLAAAPDLLAACLAVVNRIPPPIVEETGMGRALELVAGERDDELTATDLRVEGACVRIDGEWRCKAVEAILGAPCPAHWRSRCPRCGAPPLADSDDRVLCESCDKWLDANGREVLAPGNLSLPEPLTPPQALNVEPPPVAVSTTYCAQRSCIQPARPGSPFCSDACEEKSKLCSAPGCDNPKPPGRDFCSDECGRDADIPF